MERDTVTVGEVGFGITCSVHIRYKGCNEEESVTGIQIRPITRLYNFSLTNYRIQSSYQQPSSLYRTSNEKGKAVQSGFTKRKVPSKKAFPYSFV